MTVRVGVIGCGTVSYHCHLPAIAATPGVRVMALVDDDRHAAERCRARAPACDLLDTDTLLRRDDIDAVLVATPSGTHAALAKRALGAGKHVYLEKPIATTLADAAAIQVVASRSATHVMVGFNRRHHPICQAARSAVRQGDIGPVHAIHAVFAEPVAVRDMPAWKRLRESGGGALLDLASHHIDLVRFLLDAEVTSVRAHVASHESDHDHASLVLTLSSGARAHVLCSFRTSMTDTMELHGERGVLRIDRHAQRALLSTSRRSGYGVQQRALAVSESIGERMQRVLRPSRDPSYSLAWRAFVDLVAGRTTDAATLADGAASLAVVLAAEQSARDDASVALPSL